MTNGVSDFYYSQFNYFNLPVEEDDIPEDIQEIIDEEFKDEEE